MLQSRCPHSSALPLESCAFCNSSAPESLLEICLNYINKNVWTICEEQPGPWRLREGVCLPVEICERFLEVRCFRQVTADSDFIQIFRDRQRTRLKRVKLRDAYICVDDLEILLQHNLVELDVSYSTNEVHTLQVIPAVLTMYGRNLTSLHLGENTGIFMELMDLSNRDYIFLAPSLKRLSLRNTNEMPSQFYALLLQSLTTLTHLDLSGCTNLDTFSYVQNLTSLTSLVLYNVSHIDKMISAICTLRSLRHLDISQSKEDNGKYENSGEVLRRLVVSLPKLTSLDISGTNLAGRGVAEPMSSGPVYSDIPGLSSRMSTPFQYLGLYETSHEACHRHDIPAKLIAGNANEEQILVAAMTFLDRSDMLQKVLNELFHLLRFDSCAHVGQALNIVLEAMNRHLFERHVQISGSATLFYIVKGTDVQLQNVVRVKRRIITALLNGMSNHQDDETMMRNGCLTLCQFRIPADVLFDYERLVKILLYSINGMPQSFVQRIGIYLLNSLACQVDGQQKVKLGELGAIDKMIMLIADRLNRRHCDDVLEVAWSTMWNVTDETPSNCRKFLESKGMEYFLSCLERFPDKEELLRNMMGLLGNVAEVRELRHFLVTSKYLSVFSNLLDSRCDGIEVSYNAAGVISHIASDGPDVWNVFQPTRVNVLDKMVRAIDRWDLSSQRNINYRSFEPILYLVKIYHTPECQKWAVWALANLTKVYPDKYCELIEKEGGLILLQDLIDHPLPPFSVKTLAAIVIDNCRRHKELEWTNVEDHLDG